MNVGPTSRVATGALGYPVCQVCGQSRSPFASSTEQAHFQKDHEERCGRKVVEVGFYADLVADALSLPGLRLPRGSFLSCRVAPASERRRCWRWIATTWRFW